MKVFTRSNDEYTELGVAERAACGMGNFANAFVFVMLSAFMTYYYTSVIGLNPAIIGTIMLVSRIFDGVTDLGFGWILDNTKTKFGKARVWVLRTCIPFAILSILMFSVPVNASDIIKYVFVFVTYNAANAVFYTALSVAFSSSIITITRNQYERGLLATFGNVFGAIANVIVTSTALGLVNMFGGDTAAWTKAVAVYAVIGLASHFVFIFGIKERVQGVNEDSGVREEKISFGKGVKSLFSNKYWVMNLIGFCLYWVAYSLQFGASLFYAENILSDVNSYTIYQNAFNIVFPFAIASLFIPMKKFGKAKSYKAGVIIAIVGYVLVAVMPRNLVALMIANALQAIGMGFLCTCALAINADTLDYSEWKSGFRVVGMGSAVVGFSQKVGMGLGAGILGYILSFSGFDGTASVQPASALTAIRALYTFLPLAIFIVIFFTMFRYDLDKRNEEIAEGLKQRRIKSE